MAASKSLNDWLESAGGVGVNFGKTAYVARITGEHEKYNLAREFLSEKIDSSYSGKTGRKAVPDEEIAVGDVVEVRGDSWGNEQVRYYAVVDAEETDDGLRFGTERLDGQDAVLDRLRNGSGSDAPDLRRRLQVLAGDLDEPGLRATIQEAERHV